MHNFFDGGWRKDWIKKQCYQLAICKIEHFDTNIVNDKEK